MCSAAAAAVSAGAAVAAKCAGSAAAAAGDHAGHGVDGGARDVAHDGRVEEHFQVLAAAQGRRSEKEW